MIVNSWHRASVYREEGERRQDKITEDWIERETRRQKRE